jgi:O-antigen/teichoic acid export membrane protein/glycosyltransferase involved in cell wall biosynthesis
MAFWLSFAVASLVAVFLYGISEPLGMTLNMKELPAALRYSVAVIPLTASQTVPRSFLLRSYQFKKIAQIEFGSIIGASCLGIILLNDGIRIPAIFAFVVTQSTLRTILFFSAAHMRPGMKLSYDSLKRLGNQGTNILVHSLLNFITKYSDNLIVGKFLGAYALGLYSTSYRVLQVQQDNILGTMRQLVLPVYARFQKDKLNLYKELCRDIQLIVAFSMPLLLMGILWAKQLIIIVLGVRWIDATLLVQIFLLEAIRQSMTGLLPTGLIASGDSRAIARYSVISTPVLILTFFLASQLGVVWVAGSFFVVNSIFAIYLMIIFKNSFDCSIKQLVYQWIPALVTSLFIVLAHGFFAFIGLIGSERYIFNIIAIMCEGTIAWCCLFRIFPNVAADMRRMFFNNRYKRLQYFFKKREGNEKSTNNEGMHINQDTGRRYDDRHTIYLDPLKNEGNPHLTLLHSAVQERSNKYILENLHLKSLLIRKLLSLPRRRSKQSDAIHFHFINRFYVYDSFIRSILLGLKFITLVLICRLMGIKIVWTMHNERAHDFKYRKYEKLLLLVFSRMCDAIIVQCITGIDILWNTYGRNKDVFYTPHPFYNGIYSDSMSESTCRKYLNLKKGELLYTFIGRIQPYKGIDTLISTFTQWHPERHVRLHIAGPCTDKHYENTLKHLMGDDRRITFEPDFVKNEALQIYIKASSYGVLPYKEILHSSNSILYFTFGRPVIVPDIGWFPEIFQKHRVGIMYPHEMPDALMHALDASLTINRNSFDEGIRSLNDRWTLDEAANVVVQAYDHIFLREEI